MGVALPHTTLVHLGRTLVSPMIGSKGIQRPAYHTQLQGRPFESHSQSLQQRNPESWSIAELMFFAARKVQTFIDHH